MSDPVVAVPPDASAGPDLPPRLRRRAPLTPRQEERRAELVRALADPIVVAETADQLDFEADQIKGSFRPRNEWQDWVVGEMAVLLFRIKRGNREERRLRDLAALRAIDCWESDQQATAEALALRLRRQPGRVVAQLRTTPAGIDWLIDRWESLARVDSTAWTPEQVGLARLLVGGDDLVDPARPGFAAERVAILRDDRIPIAEADALVRGLVEADLSDKHVPGLYTLRQHLRTLQRQVKWYIDQFHIDHTDRWDDPRRQPSVESHRLQAYYAARPSHWRFDTPAPVEPSPRIDPAPPPAPDADAEPIAPAPPSIDPDAPPRRPADGHEPFHAAAILALTAKETARTTLDALADVADYSNERGRHHCRPPVAGELPREYVQRQRTARRRTNLALAGKG